MSDAVDNTKNKGGRPTKYTPEIADEIIRRMGEGEPVAKVADAMGLGLMTVLDWATGDRDGFRDRFESARRAQAERMDALIEGIGEVARENPAAARVMMEAARWRAQHLHRKRYGSAVDMTSGGEKLSISISKDDADL